MPKQALIVDDDPIIRNLTATLLRRKHIIAAQAVNGEEAIALLRSERLDGGSRFDLILLDLMMPKASGIDVLEFLRLEFPALLPHVIVITASAETSRERIEASGCRCILSKPFESEAFYRMVADCVRGGHPVLASGGAPRAIDQARQPS